VVGTRSHHSDLLSKLVGSLSQRMVLATTTHDFHCVRHNDNYNPNPRRGCSDRDENKWGMVYDGVDFRVESIVFDAGFEA
jgi:hypothetical protein